MKGSEFGRGITDVTSQAWEDAIFAARDSWIVWPMVDVEAPDPRGTSAVFRTTADFFAIGEPDDYLYIPMRGTTAQKIADELGLVLPTKKTIDLTWSATPPEGRLTPKPKPEVVGTSRQTSVQAAREHSATVQAQRAELGAGEGQLVRGHKKNAGVLTNRLALQPQQLSIYGWHTPVPLPIGRPTVKANQPVQPLSLIHGWNYVDYSHGVTFCDPEVRIRSGGGMVPAVNVWTSQVIDRTALLSDEGPLKLTRIPDAPKAAPVGSTPAVTKTAVLRRGSKGLDVRQMQGWLRLLGYAITVDGDFGPATDSAVRAFQARAGLSIDGAVGPATFAMLRQLVANVPTTAVPVKPERQPPTPRQYPFVQAKNYTKGRHGLPVIWIVIHTTENTEAPGVEDNVAAWFAGPSAPQASAHFCIGRHIVQCVDVDDMAWHAPGANAQGIGLEHVGRAAQTAEQWADDYSTKLLELSAGLCAELCDRFDIPVVYVDREGLLAGEPGITTHHEVSMAWRKSTHTDPGKYWPVDHYLGLVQAAG